ncbi:hypothetical protein HMPREF9946_01578 [Acetobacteraceae bacterium AT-5844]|nr:hypothetical protein HMPREF9946_01578 [Acetobacteraceae bacterium AT-5844]
MTEAIERRKGGGRPGKEFPGPLLFFFEKEAGFQCPAAALVPTLTEFLKAA